ncbi:MAG TPA: hypothetical protein V6C81_20655 [Planktothrix sp.]|jgi:hypothetical protein
MGNVSTSPPEIIEAYLILGIKPGTSEENVVRAAWRQQLTQLGRIGDAESARFLSRAKDTLIGWLRNNQLWCTPAQFTNDGPDSPYGGGQWPPPPPDDPDNPSGVPKRPLPMIGSGEISLPLPDYGPSVD